MADAAPIRVILDDRPMRNALTGVGNYIAQLLLHAQGLPDEFQISPFMHRHLLRRDWRERAEPTGGIPPRPGAPASPSVGGRIPWTLRNVLQAAYSTAFRAMTRSYQLYHEPNHIPMRSSLPTITTIHDLSVITHSEWHPQDRVRWYERDFDAGVRQSRHFIAASAFTRREMVERLRIAPERITVTYQAPRAAFRPPANPHVPMAGVPARFLLFVGTLEPRKNVDGLLEAYAALPAGTRTSHPLLIAGAWGWKAEALQQKLSDRALSADVKLLGYQNDAQLAQLYARCTAFVWPTWYEGFGLPPLEAMACGAAVIVSNVASLPEVVGDAGVLLDPHDPGVWTAAMRRICEDEQQRRDLRERGLVQAARFGWASFIEATFAAYRKALAR